MPSKRSKCDKSNIRDAKAEAKEEKYWSKIDAEEKMEEDAGVKDNNIKCILKQFDKKGLDVEEAIRTNREEVAKLEDLYVMLEKQYKMYARVGPEYIIFIEESIDANRAEAASLEKDYEMLVAKHVKLTSMYDCCV